MEENTAHEGAPTEHAGQHEEVDTLYGIVFPYVNFAMFIALAYIFFKKPARAAAEKRRAEFQALLADAAKAKEAAEAKLKELTTRQAGLERELTEMRETSRVAAEADAKKIVADAEVLAEHLKAEAKRIAEAEVLNARESLRKEIVAAVKSNVEQKIKSELNGDAQLNLVRKHISDLKTVRAEG